MADICIP